MPQKTTLRDILPVLWKELELGDSGTTRTINRATYDRVMKSTETIVSPSVLKRMWETLGASDYAMKSTAMPGVLILDVTAIRVRLIADGHTLPIVTHTQHTHTTHTGRAAE